MKEGTGLNRAKECSNSLDTTSLRSKCRREGGREGGEK